VLHIYIYIYIYIYDISRLRGKYTLYTFPFIFQFPQNFEEMAYLNPEDGGSKLF